ncbi:biopolymer transporter ExbD [Lysobacter lacus]|uniref:Biopolymer transporter ExbD n=2 Tax=Cognatilysobacter lacus TaxID=1643323 RepID=A0A5D8Z7V8_9GAMM|nr:biopolymer transporter ExbD [Lysobacter lacus]
MADMNVTPLVDVMLVLLIIFMVTAPISSYPIDINLPQPTLNPPPVDKEPPPPVSLVIDASGAVTWDHTPMPMSQLESVMRQTVQRDPTNQPRVEIDVNGQAQYEALAKVLAYSKNAGMDKIGFVQHDQ